MYVLHWPASQRRSTQRKHTSACHHPRVLQSNLYTEPDRKCDQAWYWHHNKPITNAHPALAVFARWFTSVFDVLVRPVRLLYRFLFLYVIGFGILVQQLTQRSVWIQILWRSANECFVDFGIIDWYRLLPGLRRLQIAADVIRHRCW